MASEPGLRERKKQQTRQRIMEAALDLFAQRGFDNVPVAEVARAADVSEATVFNYFAAKEDLVYAGMAAYEETLLDTLRARPAGTTVLAAFRDIMLQPRGALAAGDPAAIARIATTARLIAGSTALQAREQRIFARTTRDLARLLADEAGAPADDIRPWVVANALMGVNRALMDAVRRQALAGRGGRAIARAVVAEARRALDLLEHGLARYALKH
jgi:AcrR family transcriptional regulator